MITAYYDAYFDEKLVPVFEILGIDAPGTEAELEAAILKFGMEKQKDKCYIQTRGGLSITLLVEKLRKCGYKLRRSEGATKNDNAFIIPVSKYFDYVCELPGTFVDAIDTGHLKYSFFEKDFYASAFYEFKIFTLESRNRSKLFLQIWFPITKWHWESDYKKACDEFVAKEVDFKDYIKFAADKVYYTICNA